MLRGLLLAAVLVASAASAAPTLDGVFSDFPDVAVKARGE